MVSAAMSLVRRRIRGLLHIAAVRCRHAGVERSAFVHNSARRGDSAFVRVQLMSDAHSHGSCAAARRKAVEQGGDFAQVLADRRRRRQRRYRQLLRHCRHRPAVHGREARPASHVNSCNRLVIDEVLFAHTLLIHCRPDINFLKSLYRLPYMTSTR